MSDRTLARRTAVKLYFKGADISKELSKYLLSLSFTDKEENEADDISISLDDREGKWIKDWLSTGREKGTKRAFKGTEIHALVVQKNFAGDGKDKTVYGLSSPSMEEIQAAVPDLFPALQVCEELGITWETISFYPNKQMISFTMLQKSSAGIGLTVFLDYHPNGEIVVPDYFTEVPVDGTDCWKLYYAITEMGGI